MRPQRGRRGGPPAHHPSAYIDVQQQPAGMVMALPGTEQIHGIYAPPPQQQQMVRQYNPPVAGRRRTQGLDHGPPHPPAPAPMPQQQVYMSLDEGGPPPFVPRRGRPDGDMGSQGRFKRQGTESPQVAMGHAPDLSADMARYGPLLGMPNAAAMDAGGGGVVGKIITLEEAEIMRPMGDKDDPLGYAKQFGLTPEHVATLDKNIRWTRWKPTPVMIENVERLEERLRNENRLGARGIAQVLYKCGARAIWILPKGHFYYGTEAAYLLRMGATTMAQAFAKIVDE